MHLGKALTDVVQRELACLYIVEQTGHLAQRCEQSGQVGPVARTDLGVGTQRTAYVVHRLQLGFLQTRDERVAQEFLNAYRVECLTMLQRAVADLAVVVAEHLGVGATQLLKLQQHVASVPHLLHRIGR